MRVVLLGCSLLVACHSGKRYADTGTSDVAVEPTPHDDDRDGSPSDEDCDDTDPAALPGAEEICDGIDNDCDGEVDEGVTIVVYTDADGDGYGDDTSATETCEPEDDQVLDGSDCDDADPQIHPWAYEACDGIDNDCDLEIDEGTVDRIWYLDVDGDGYGDPATETTACTDDAPEGHVADGTDCDDTDPQVYPGAPERCDEVDNDCNGLVDDGVITTWYADMDGDGAGNPTLALTSCNPPPGYVTNGDDCDDALAEVSPWATEICNGIDDDCDTIVDEDDAIDVSDWLQDSDGDGFGDPDTLVTACDAPSGYTDVSGDCDDLDAAVHPDATEICNGIDDDCDTYIDTDDSDISGATTWYIDHDGDGFGSADYAELACEEREGWSLDATDCDDLEATVHPGADEVCNGDDEDCDGEIDEDAIDEGTWYADADGDGFGDLETAIVACDASDGQVDNSSDCDDDDAAVHPEATEICNGIDDDCDAAIDADDSDISGATTWYIDHDGDGFGSADYAELACEEREGWSLDASDCDDLDEAVFPGAEEICNGIDDDCDGSTAWIEHDDDDNGTVTCAQALWLRSSSSIHNDPTYAAAYGSLQAAAMLDDHGMETESSDLATLTISADLLHDVGLLVLYGQGSYGPLSAASAAALDDWVSDGGSLLYIGGWGHSSSCTMINSLPSGLGLGCAAYGSTWSGVSSIAGTHPLLDGVGSIIGLGGEKWTVTSPSETLATTGGWATVTVLEYGDGRVVGMSDEWPFYNAGTNGYYDISALDNAVLIDNIWAWLSDFEL